jgi:ubiquitin-protein ligase
MKLMMSGKYDVTILSENSMSDFEVMFKGPKDSNYEGVSKSIILKSFCREYGK